MKKSCFLASTVLSLGFIACSKAPVPQPESQVTVTNGADAHEVQVYWTANGCAGMDVKHGAADVCHEETISARKSSTYIFPKGTTGRSVLLYRPEDYCALTGGSDLTEFKVPGDEALRTDGCVLQKNRTQSSMLRPEAH